MSNISYGDLYSDLYDEIYRDFLPSVSQISFLARYAGAGALELGVGSGRIAIPLAEAGVEVVGMDNSPDMGRAFEMKIAQKKLSPTISVVIGSAASMYIDRRFSVIYAPFNFLYLAGDDAEKLSVMKNARNMLTNDGVFVVELFIPKPGRRLPDGKWPAMFPSGLHDLEIKAIEAQFTMLTASKYDEKTGIWTLSEIIFRNACTPKVICSQLHCVSAEHVDTLAGLAGLRLKSRYSDWDEAIFSADSCKHISVYELASKGGSGWI